MDGATSRGLLKKTTSHSHVHREIQSGQCPNLDFCSQVSLGCGKLVMKLTKTDINTDNAMIFYQEVCKTIADLVEISRQSRATFLLCLKIPFEIGQGREFGVCGLGRETRVNVLAHE